MDNHMDDTYQYNSVIVAKYIAAKANSMRYNINMTKIQKLLYIAYGIYLAVKDVRLTNEHPKAWPYGPVFPTTRNKLSKVNLEDLSIDDPSLSELKENPEINSMLDLVFSTYGKMTATELTAWSHQDNSPWAKAVNDTNFKWGNVIDDQFIKEYFLNKIERDAQ